MWLDLNIQVRVLSTHHFTKSQNYTVDSESSRALVSLISVWFLSSWLVSRLKFLNLVFFGLCSVVADWEFWLLALDLVANWNRVGFGEALRDLEGAICCKIPKLLCCCPSRPKILPRGAWRILLLRKSAAWMTFVDRIE